jgi:hypothetical protein
MRRLLALGVLTIWLVPAASPTSAEQAAAGRAGSGTPQKPAPAPASTAMTNADVVKLVKAGLGEDIIVSAIRSSKERKFKLDADGLVQLKSDGVPDRVIAVMLNPDAAPAPAPASAPAPPPATAAAAPAPTPSIGGAPVSTAAPVAEVSIVTRDGTNPVTPEGGDMSTSYAVVKMVVWANFRGLASDVRLTDKRPSILVKTNESKFDTRFMLVKTEADEDDNQRSVRIKSGIYTVSTAFVPDSGWVIATKATQESPGVWRMTLSKDLGRGEYGILDTQNRYLYGFAVEK